MKLHVQASVFGIFITVGFLCILLMDACSIGGTGAIIDSPSTTALYGKNVIVNGDAESGKSDLNGDIPVSTIPGWTKKGDIDVVPYGSPIGVAAKTDPGPSNRGKNMFTGGPDTASTSVSQNVDVSTISTDINGGNVSFTLSGYLGGFSSQEDNAVLAIQFVDTTGRVLANVQIGPVTATDRNDKTGLVQRTSTGKVPKGTAKVLVTLRMTRAAGAYNDGYADNLSLVFQKA